MIVRVFEFNPVITSLEEAVEAAKKFEEMLIEDHGINPQSAYRMGWNLAVRIWEGK